MSAPQGPCGAARPTRFCGGLPAPSGGWKTSASRRAAIGSAGRKSWACDGFAMALVPKPLPTSVPRSQSAQRWHHASGSVDMDGTATSALPAKPHSAFAPTRPPDGAGWWSQCPVRIGIRLGPHPLVSQRHFTGTDTDEASSVLHCFCTRHRLSQRHGTPAPDSACCGGMAAVQRDPATGGGGPGFPECPGSPYISIGTGIKSSGI